MKARALLIAIASALLITACIPPLVGAQSALVPDRPLAGLLLTWQDDPTSTMTIDWQHFLSQQLPEPRLSYRAERQNQWHEVMGVTVPDVLPGRRIFRAHLTELMPDTTYEFRVEGHGRTYRFRTMPTRLNPSLTFAIGGDTRHQQAWMEQMNRVIMQYDPQFIVWGGDLAYADGVRADFWYQWFDAVKNTLVTPDGRVIPVIVGIGNHEVQGGFFRTLPEYQETDAWRQKVAPFFYGLFAFPGQPGYGVLDFGDYLSLIILDSDHTNSVTGPQSAWLENVLASRTHMKHVIPVYHVTAYPSVRSFSGTTEGRIRQTWLPLFEQYGVRMAFENHDHAFKRTVPIRAGAYDPSGIVYFGDGAWGVTPRDIHPVAGTWYLSKAESIRHGMLVTLDESGARVLTLSADGHVIDRYDVNGVFIESPQSGALVGADEPIRVWIDPSIQLQHVRIEQNGTPLYEGPALPANLHPGAPTYQEGDLQRLTVTVTDGDGRIRQQEVSFGLKRVHLRSPGDGVRVRGELPISAAIGLETGEQVTRVALSLRLIRGLEEHPEYVLFEASELPQPFTLDTLQIDDATYDLRLTVHTDRGAIASDVRRIIVRNWDTLVELFEPPTNLFGLQLPKLKTHERSEGWEHATDQPERFFGDRDRLYPTESGAFLTWHHPRLRRFTLTVYATEGSVTNQLEIAVSSDNLDWHPVTFTAHTQADTEGDWLKLVLTGSIPDDLNADYMRITWHGAAGDGIQFGHAELTGQTR